MSENRLIPRVGDRVIVSRSRTGTGSRMGDVVEIDSEGGYRVDVHGWPEMLIVNNADDLTVVDREPIEWPDVPCWEYGDIGWSQNKRRFTNDLSWHVQQSKDGPQVECDASALTAGEALAIATAWSYVSQHFDELTGSH